MKKNKNIKTNEIIGKGKISGMIKPTVFPDSNSTFHNSFSFFFLIFKIFFLFLFNERCVCFCVSNKDLMWARMPKKNMGFFLFFFVFGSFVYLMRKKF